MNVTIHSQSMRNEDWFPREIRIPAEKEQQFEKQAQHNHSQTVSRLNQRGGMDPTEIYAAYSGMDLLFHPTRQQHIEAIKLCVELAADGKK